MTRTLFLVGPTAAGKTAVAIELARQLDAEIVSADSMQVYRGLDIGAAKPTPGQQRAAPHHMIDVLDPGEVCDAKWFAGRAAEIIAALHARGRTALVAGGSGLYVRALRFGLFEGPGRDPALRERLENMSAEQLCAMLEAVDPVTAARIDRRNKRRLVRALEVFAASGQPIAVLQQQWPPMQPARGETLGSAPAFALDRDRADLHARIERRIDEQLAAGWVEETRRLLARGLERNPVAMQAAGYRELAAHLRGQLSLPAATALIKTRTRQLARRQLTWFRREPGLDWIEIGKDESPAQTASRILGRLGAAARAEGA
jgi:tRNA dimethylallyltransferase